MRKARPKAEQIVNRRFKQLKSNYELRSLGIGADGEVLISEEERDANFHIIGAPGEGKSKFLEYNIRKDIAMGNGLCLLDPSEQGKTCYDILRYCASIGHKKVHLIDPATLDRYGKIACIQPLNKKYVKASVSGVMELVSILFGTKEVDTPRIKRNLSAVLRMLCKTGNTLYETVYFSDYHDKRRMEILDQFSNYDRDVRTIENVFRSQYVWENYFFSTINRMEVFWEEPFSLMFAANEGIDFIKMISEGWVILVNVAPGKRMSLVDCQLLGVLIIAQLIQAVDILQDNSWKGVYYLYMDEAARFATTQIDTLLSYKRKSGLRLVLAHHYFNQFKDREVLNSIKQNARIKLMFNTPSHEDRLEMVKALGYGGNIPAVLAAYANQDLPKQQAVIKKNKEAPVRIRIPDVPDVNVEKEKLDKYIESLLTAEWYKSREEINEQINARNARSVQTNTERPKPRKASHRKSANTSSVPRGVQERKQKQSVSKGEQKPPTSPQTKPIKI